MSVHSISIFRVCKLLHVKIMTYFIISEINFNFCAFVYQIPSGVRTIRVFCHVCNVIVALSYTMTDGGGSEGNGRISNIMNSLWSNNGNDDTLFDTFKLVYFTRYVIYLY